MKFGQKFHDHQFEVSNNNEYNDIIDITKSVPKGQKIIVLYFRFIYQAHLT